MGEESTTKTIKLMTIIGGAMIVISLAIAELTGNGVIAVIGSVAGVTGTSLAISQFLAESDGKSTSASQTNGAARHRPAPTGARSPFREEKTAEEYAREMEADPHFHNYGEQNFPRRSVKIFRAITSVVNWLPISDRGVTWSRRFALGVGAFCYLWLFLVIGRIVEAVVPDLLPEAVRTLVYLVPPVPSVLTTSTNGLVITYALYLILPGLIVITLAFYVVARRKSICEKCETPFVLECVGCYSDKDPQTQTKTDRNGEEYDVTTVQAQQVVRCRREACGEYDINDTTLFL